MNRLYKNVFLTAGMTLPLLLGGCGGGSGGATAPTAGTPLTSITGIVIDDKVNGATVCLDANQNNMCDAGELTAPSMNSGNYTISNVPAADVNKPLIAVLGTNAVIISAATGAATNFGKNAAYAASGGQKDALGNQNITPLTTMVKRVQDNTGATVAAAQSIVKQKLGLTGSTVDLLGDYTAVIAGDSYAVTVAKAKLLKVAQVSTQVIADNYTGIAGAGATGNSGQVYTVIIDQILANLSTMSTTIDQYTAAGTFTIASAAGSVPLVNTANLTALNQLLGNATVQQVTGISLKALLAGFGKGVNSLWSWSQISFAGGLTSGTQVNLNVGKVKLNATTGLFTTQDWYANGVWQANGYTGWQANNYTGWHSAGAASSNNNNYLQTLDPATGTIAFSGMKISLATIAINANGTATITNTTGPQQSNVTIRATNVTGQSIVSAIRVPEHGDGWLVPLAANASFTSPYAQAWDMTETALNDQYSIWSWNDPTYCAQSGVPYVANVTNCNVAPLVDRYGNAVWNPLTGIWTPATTLADIIVVDPYARLTDPYAIMQVDPYARFSNGWALLATSKTAATGTIRYYDWTVWNWNQATPPIAVATWTRTTIGTGANAHNMISWAIPPVVQSLYGYQGTSSEFRIENQGYVYWGKVVPAGTSMTSRLFNNNALQDIKNAIGLPSALGAP